MSNLANHLNQSSPPHLSVSYKTSQYSDHISTKTAETIIITDPDFYITGFNPSSDCSYHNNPTKIIGKFLFDFAKFELIGCKLEEAVMDLFRKGSWNGNMLFHTPDQQKVVIQTKCTVLKDKTGNTSSIIFVNKKISEKNATDIELVNAENKYQTVVEALSEGVLLLSPQGIIEANNKKALEILETTEDKLKGRYITNDGDWYSIKEDGSIFPDYELPAIITLRTGIEKKDVIKGLVNSAGQTKWLSINSRAIFKEGNNAISSVVVTFKDITDFKIANEKLKQNEMMFKTFMANTPTLGWIYDEESNFIYGNPRFKEIVGYGTEKAGTHVSELTKHKEIIDMVNTRIREVLIKNEPVVGEDEVYDKDGNLRYYLSHWFLLPESNGKKLIGGHSVEITEAKKAQKEIDTMHQRFTYAINASSEAIWEYDVLNNNIYRSDTFYHITGYDKNTTNTNLGWAMERIHPDDKPVIKQRLEYYIKNKIVQWEDEYRFKVEDGSYRHLLDRALAIYENGQLTKVIGAMQDITDRKKLEEKLVEEKVQKQKLVNKATLKAQENERNRISSELHDNVNQLLMSANLHIGVAKINDETREEMLNKASAYVLMAVEEIRNLSKTLNANVITSVGLQKGILDIVNGMRLSKGIDVNCQISSEVAKKISVEQQLMIYRIIQEQTTNILKYSEASEARIVLKENNDIIVLEISDNGKGFDKNAEKVKGIGFINIFNRVDAYDGIVNIITSPGNGCSVIISFPINEE